MTRDVDVKWFEDIASSWENYFRWWNRIHWTFGILAIMLSTLVAAKPQWLLDHDDGTTAWLMALTTGLSTMFGAAQRGGAYRTAWSILRVSILQYKETNSTVTLSDVADAYARGEAIIHADEPDAKKGRRQIKKISKRARRT
jgi:hypothetical protein